MTGVKRVTVEEARADMHDAITVEGFKRAMDAFEAVVREDERERAAGEAEERCAACRHRKSVHRERDGVSWCDSCPADDAGCTSFEPAWEAWMEEGCGEHGPLGHQVDYLDDMGNRRCNCGRNLRRALSSGTSGLTEAQWPDWHGEYGVEHDLRMAAEEQLTAVTAERDEALAALRLWEPFFRESYTGDYLLNDEGGLIGCIACEATKSGMSLSGPPDEHRDPFYHDDDCDIVKTIRALTPPASTEENA